ncbi:unnamed protein product [Gongylonema pulchrum]|uniref:Secreted protein n=1 Tax=Gongylonema pulchrum TaxID=637853 RepID=A0A183EZN7_9BILA|nr:unnamed protein product [Gongylonema pulchrum]
MRLQRQQAVVAAGAAYANLRRNGCGSALLPPNTALSSLARAVETFPPKGEFIISETPRNLYYCCRRLYFYSSSKIRFVEQVKIIHYGRS